MHYTILLSSLYVYIDTVRIGIQEDIKGDGVDHDSGLGTSRYKSTMSCTMSDVRMDIAI